MPIERSCTNLYIKAPKTATVILIPRLESLREVKISDPKKVISIKIEAGKR